MSPPGSSHVICSHHARNCHAPGSRATNQPVGAHQPARMGGGGHRRHHARHPRSRWNPTFSRHRSQALERSSSPSAAPSSPPSRGAHAPRQRASRGPRHRPRRALRRSQLVAALPLLHRRRRERRFLDVDQRATGSGKTAGRQVTAGRAHHLGNVARTAIDGARRPTLLGTGRISGLAGHDGTGDAGVFEARRRPARAAPRESRHRKRTGPRALRRPRPRPALPGPDRCTSDRCAATSATRPTTSPNHSRTANGPCSCGARRSASSSSPHP